MTERDRFSSSPEPAEEPWEQDIAELLSELPPVEPPPGFLESMIDRPPLHARRLALGSLGMSMALVVGAVALGMFGPGRVAPPLDWVSERHRAVQGGAGARVSLEALVAVDPRIEMSEPDDPPVSLPADFEHRVDLRTEDLQQAIFAHGDETVSVFAQPGRVDFDALGRDRVRRVDGVEVWIDDAAGIMIVETDDSVVTVVGLSMLEMTQLLSAIERPTNGVWTSAAQRLAGQLGFPED